MKRLIIPAAALCLLLGGAGCSQKAEAQTDSAPATPAEKLKERLEAAMSDSTVLFGHHDDPVYGHTWAGKGTSDMVEVCGAYPAVMSWDLGALELGKKENLDGVPFDSIRSQAIAQDARGGINTFSWHLYHPLTGADSWDVSHPDAVSSIVNTPEGKAAYLIRLDLLADFFLSLKNKQGENIGVIFRPWHEHTGSWFWWGTGNCSADDYKALWKIMREKFDERGVDNVVWAYSPDRCSSAETYLERYPGDEFADILGADVYHFNGEEGADTYRNDAATTLKIAASEAKKRGKIAAFTETGLESLTMPEWYTTVLLPILEQNPVAYVTVWRNAHDKPEHFYVPYPGHPAVSDFKKFTQSPLIKVIPAK